MVVIFEAIPHAAHEAEYFSIAAQLLPTLQKIDGFISIERFKSLSSPEKLLSLSFWRDENAVRQWRNNEAHQAAQQKGRVSIFEYYKITVADVTRQYDLTAERAPEDDRC